MSLWRKKPIVIEAFRWTGDDEQTEDPIWIVQAIKDGKAWFSFKTGQFMIATLEGNHAANPGDWIIKGVQGELYPCKPDIFAATYESAE